MNLDASTNGKAPEDRRCYIACKPDIAYTIVITPHSSKFASLDLGLFTNPSIMRLFTTSSSLMLPTLAI